MSQNCELGNMDLQFVTSISELRMWVSRFVFLLFPFEKTAILSKQLVNKIVNGINEN